jgi:hypothetical protein
MELKTLLKLIWLSFSGIEDDVHDKSVLIGGPDP